MSIEQQRTLGNLCVFAARYAHGRNTGASLATVTAIKSVWMLLSEGDRAQVVHESTEAQYQDDVWQELRDFAKEYKE